MANLKEIKNEALYQAQHYKTKEAASKYYSDKLSKIRRIRERVNSEIHIEQITRRRTLAGLEAYEAYLRECKVRDEALYKIGTKMKSDAAGRLSPEEKRVIKAEMKEVKQATRYTKRRTREIGRRKDAEGRKVSSYLDAKIEVAKALVENPSNLYKIIQQNSRVV